MNLRFQHDAGEIADLQVLWEDSQYALYRGQRLKQGSSSFESVLIAVPAAEQASPAVLDRLAREYDLRDELDETWAVRPLDLVRQGSRTLLLLDDPGGEPLERLIGAPMDIDTFLRLAIDIAKVLSEAHSSGLIHKDVKPANIFVNCANGRARLAGFGLASRLPRERRAQAPPEIIAGTLAYMAPEQTGRMNRSIDSRADLYALGVSFYRMLTGVLPFNAADPMEWVHCHIARKPVAAAERCGSVPAPISDIVAKLLAKTAEERYQTAAGLGYDLRHCLDEWIRQSHIARFSLGERDAPDRLLIPEKLYGREHEVKTLLAAFDRVVDGGGPELVVVAGQGGVGKSVLVAELHRALVPSRGLFASGKFDQLKRDIPYASLAQALQGLIRPLLGKSEADLAPWRSALIAALGPNGALMATLAPELEILIGPQPPTPELPPRDAQRRFQLALRRLLAAFARPEHPLVLFLDDLQWLDAATLELIEDLLAQPDLQHLLVIGAYRDDEVTSAHPLMRRLAAIGAAGRRVQEITLKPLGLEDVSRMVAEALRSRPIQALARLVHAKTAGNPFFAIQFLTGLADEGLLAFDRDAASWRWDLKQIRAKDYTDNVADFMLRKLRRLPVATRTALQQLACLGSATPVATLALVRGDTEDAVHATVGPAIRARILFREGGAYRFLHDRVREAAYALIPDGERQAVHLAIGRRLLADGLPTSVEDSIFEIVGQLNRGSDLINADEERERLAELNLIAGQRAKFSTAYSSALIYLAAGTALLPADAWRRRHDLAFALEVQRAECEFLTGALAEAEARLAGLADRATRPPELATVARLRVDLFMTLDRSDRAIAVGLECLRRFGIGWSTHPTAKDVEDEYSELSRQLGDRPVEALLDLPSMADPIACAAIDVLTSLVTPALFTDEKLRCRIICRMGNLCLAHGNSDASCYVYAAVGNVVSLYFGNYELGFRFGELGVELAASPGMERLRARVYLAFSNLAKPSPRHFRNGRPIAQYTFEAAQQAGDVTYAVISRNNLVTQLLAAGAPLSNVEREAEVGLNFARGAGFGLVEALITAQIRFIRMLRGLSSSFGSFNENGFDERQFEERLEAEPSRGIAACTYWIRKLQARVLSNDHASAFAAAISAERLLWMSPVIFERADYHFYAALAVIGLWDFASAGQRSHYREKLTDHQRQLRAWAEHCPENFASRAALLDAEIARLQDREIEAERLFEQAIRSARANGLVHEEGLASELAARFYGARGFEDIAHLYLRKARSCYSRWGADGKVRQLDDIHPQLSEQERPPGPTSTIGTRVEQLDLATITKVSQAVSGEMNLERLIDTLLRTAIEQAGAERGLLIFSQQDGPQLKASARTTGHSIVVEQREEPVSASMLPLSVLNHVVRSSEFIVLDDAEREAPFSADPYIMDRRVRSVLCLPLLNRASFTGVLYLENNLSPGVFSPRHTAVLKLLASQAAITLENALLYRDLEQREAKISRLVDANIIGIFTWRIPQRDSKDFLLEVNDAFLQMLGYDRDEYVSGRMPRFGLTPPEWRERDTQTLAELRQFGVCRPFEKEYFRKDGSRVPVLIGAASFDATRSEGVAFVLDLTERKQAEEALRRSETYLAEAQRLSNSGAYAFNAAGSKYWSEELYRIWGFDPLQGIPDREIWQQRLHPDDRDSFLEKYRAGQRQKREYAIDYRIVLPDGTIRHLRSIGRPSYSAAGEFIEVVGTTIDVTERKQAEAERERVRQLETDLAHLNRLGVMGELTASLAHEILHPIATARNNARAGMRFLEMKRPDLGEVMEALACVVRDADRAKDIVGRIRDHIKKSPPREETFDINEAIDEVIVMVRHAIDRNSVAVYTRLKEDLMSVDGDRVQLQQVMLNLILNAVEAMSSVGEGPRELSISTGPGDRGGILVAVADSGPGIDPEHLDLVFKPFHTTKPSGMGMGLSICQSIIAAHGGRLWAEANRPRGAIFQFTLPARSDNP